LLLVQAAVPTAIVVTVRVDDRMSIRDLGAGRVDWNGSYVLELL